MRSLKRTGNDFLRPTHLISILIFLLPLASLTIAHAQSPAECDAKFLTAEGGMRAYWTFDDFGNPAQDNYDGHHGLNHGATWTSEGAVGGALSFDGIDDFVEVPHDPAFDFTAWDSYTIAVWFLNDGGGYHGQGYGQKVFAKNTVGEDLWMSVYPPDLPNWHGDLQVVTCHDADDIGDCDFMYDHTHDFNCNEWHHAVLVKNGAQGELWVDGILKDTTDEMQAAVNTQPLFIGFSPHPDHFQQIHWSGLIDELAIFDRTLTTDEILDLYETSAAGLGYCAGHETQIWYVPGDAPTIQAGLDLAEAGDIVEVACGTYYEHDIVMNPGVRLRSETGVADCVIIDAQQQGRLMYCQDAMSPTRVEGITFTGGSSTDAGAGLYIQNSRFYLTDCVLMNNEATLQGGGLLADGSTVNVSGCSFVGNTATWGGGLCLIKSLAWLDRSLVAFNTGASIHTIAGSLILSCCDLFGNSQGDWIGHFADQVAERGNFAADPCFCNPEVGLPMVCADSFCLPGNHPWGCFELVGALGEGCQACDCEGPVATLLQTFTAEAGRAEVVLRWQVSSSVSVSDFQLTGTDGSITWPVAIDTPIGDEFRAVDRAAQLAAGGAIAYDLSIRTDDQSWQLLDRRVVNLTPQPVAARLLGAHPNPFNPATTIDFELSRTTVTSLTIYDLTGKRIRSILTDEMLPAGPHARHWHGTDDQGRRVPSGVYAARLQAGDAGASMLIVMLK